MSDAASGWKPRCACAVLRCACAVPPHNLRGEISLSRTGSILNLILCIYIDTVHLYCVELLPLETLHWLYVCMVGQSDASAKQTSAQCRIFSVEQWWEHPGINAANIGCDVTTHQGCGCDVTMHQEDFLWVPQEGLDTLEQWSNKFCN